MALFHRFLGLAVVAVLLAIALFGLGLLIARRDEAPKVFWAVQHYTENILILQAVVGVILLLLGRRVASTGGAPAILHYFYGSLFPLIAIVSGRISGLRRERRDYVGVMWGAFFAFGLTLRALMTGWPSLFGG